jgi:hypothetical protein
MGATRQKYLKPIYKIGLDDEIPEMPQTILIKPNEKEFNKKRKALSDSIAAHQKHTVYQ